jgi:Tol biopolymer transport system component
MSDDGTLIAYATYRDREVPYFGGPISALFTSWVYDHDDRTTRMLAEYPFSNPNVGVCTPVGPRVAADGSSAAADCGPNGAAFYDRSTDSVTQLSRGRQMNSSLPASGGQLIYFAGQDEGIWPAVKMDVFVMNADTEEYRRVSDLELTWTLGLWAASSDGRYVAIDGSDENSFNDAWVVDTQTGESLSLARDLGLALDDTRLRLSGSGGLAVFASGATDLVEGDTNGTVDIFVVQLQDDAAELAGG